MTVRLAYHDARVLASASKSRGRRVHRDLAAIAAENSNCQRLSAKFDILRQEYSTGAYRNKVHLRQPTKTIPNLEGCILN